MKDIPTSTFPRDHHEYSESRNKNNNTSCPLFTPEMQTCVVLPWPCEKVSIRSMKFRKILRKQVEQTLPDWRDKFLSYKDLKKQLKLIRPKDTLNSPQLEAHVTKEVNHFLHLLEVEKDKFNAFFVENEEEYVIRWKELQDKVDGAIDSDSDVELMSLGREIVDFHGEMILLENYSLLNYIGLVKIIKKYDKRTGALHRLPFIQEVLNQPFFKIDVLNKLVKECEAILSILFPSDGPSGPSFSTCEDFQEDGCGSMTGNENRENPMQVPEELPEIENIENMFIKLTLTALHTLEEIRGGSSTVSI